MQHDAEAVVPLRLRRKVEADARALDPLLGPADALGHRGLGNQEGIRDLRRRQPTDRAQGERELRRSRQRGVTAHEQEREGVVVVKWLPWVGQFECSDGLFSLPPSALDAPVIHEPS